MPHDADDETPNSRMEALMEAMAHLSSAQGILVPLVMLEEQRERKQKEREAQKNAETFSRKIPA